MTKIIQHIGFDDEVMSRRQHERYINRTLAAEAIDRMEKHLFGDEAVKHYNDWMKGANLEELMLNP